jgi:zinc D-Ala-D-Ala carboxypeptidase
VISGALSRHFTLAELTASDTAARLGIDNTPPPSIVEALRETAGRLEAAREILCAAARRDIPIVVTSAYRCEALERVICERAYAAWCRSHSMMPGEASWGLYFSRKQHPRGRAADWRAPRFGTPLEVCRALEPHLAALGIDQLIHEYASWTHTGWPEPGTRARHQVLTIDARGARAGLWA